MTLILAEALEELIALGVEGPALVAAIRRLEDATYGRQIKTLEEAVAAATQRADEALAEARAAQPRTGAERTRLYRERRAASDEPRHTASPIVTGVTEHVTVVTSGDAGPFPPPPSPQTPQPPPPIPAKEKPTRAKGRRVPEAWLPSVPTLRVAAEEGFSAGEIERELAKFRDHEFTKPRGDWDATFRNWLRSPLNRPAKPMSLTHDRQQQRPQPTPRQSNAERAFAGFEIAADHGRRRFGGS